jgi:hypothetical protein
MAERWTERMAPMTSLTRPIRCLIGRSAPDATPVEAPVAPAPAKADTRVRGRLLLGLSVLAVSACGVLPGSSSAAEAVPTTAIFETVDGYALGPLRMVSGAAFHRLESDARATWLASHPDDTLSGFELRSRAASADFATAPADVLEFLMVVTVVGGERHVVALRCDPVTFPAKTSCS